MPRSFWIGAVAVLWLSFLQYCIEQCSWFKQLFQGMGGWNKGLTEVARVLA